MTDHQSIDRPRRLPDGPFHAMTWGWVGRRGSWSTPEARASFEAMRETGANWVVLAYAAVQESAQSTEILWPDPRVVDEEEIRLGVAMAREFGMRVCLKPTVNVADGTWRAHISFFDEDVPGEPTWDQWFDAYDRYILANARLAEELGAELFVIGCEMVRADSRSDRWRFLAARVRALYSGPVAYNCDKYQEERLSWWDAVDVLGSSAYYPAGSWAAQLDRIRPVVERYGRDFLFLEAGCPSRDTSPARPNDWALPGAPDEAAQAAYLDEMFDALDSAPWVRGLALWDWPPSLYSREEASRNTDYCVFGKLAERVVERHFDRGAGHCDGA